MSMPRMTDRARHLMVRAERAATANRRNYVAVPDIVRAWTEVLPPEERETVLAIVERRHPPRDLGGAS